MEASGLHYPNRLSRALFQALERTAGPSSLVSALEIAGLDKRFAGGYPPDDMQPGLDFAEIAAFNQVLEALYGARGGRGIALRVGAEMFDIGMKGVGVLKGITTPEFAALPPPAQAQISLMGLAAVFTNTTDQASKLVEDGDTLRFIVNPSPAAWERTSDKPVCHLIVGILQANLRWATGGYEFAVHETACQATGADSCLFLVNKKPIGRV